MAAGGTVLHHTDFRRAIAQNKRATLLFTLMLLWLAALVGYVLGWAVGILTEIWTLPDTKVAHLTIAWIFADLGGRPRPEALIGAATLASLSAGWGAVVLFVGGNVLAVFTGARDANAADMAERRFLDVVHEMAVAAGLPPPRAMVIDTPTLNAFASGTSPDRAIITATSGLIAALSREELQGVVGHEMAHIADYDVRYVTLVTAMAGVIVLFGHLLQDMLRYEFVMREPDQHIEHDPDASGSGGVPLLPRSANLWRLALTAVVVAIVAVLALIAPLAARLVQLAISREREYLADATSVEFTRNPLGLIGALTRLAHADTAIARESSPVSALCIASSRPLTEGMLSTHPPIEDRIARLRNLGGPALPDTGAEARTSAA